MLCFEKCPDHRIGNQDLPPAGGPSVPGNAALPERRNAAPFLHPRQPFCSEKCLRLFQADSFDRPERRHHIFVEAGRGRVSVSVSGGAPAMYFPLNWRSNGFLARRTSGLPDRCRDISRRASRRRCGALGTPAGHSSKPRNARSRPRSAYRAPGRNSSSLTSSSTGAELAPCRTPSESRIGFDGQMVCRNVLYVESDSTPSSVLFSESRRSRECRRSGRR